MARLAKSVRVTGRVQGVFYRAWTRQQAEAIGAAGWIRNAADGSVEALVEGDETAVAALIDAMREGPDGAEVTNVEIVEAEPENLEHFAVRH